ncbi:MAG TPA: hypothetical protein VF094_11565 [Gaiellaceae bacterium]
MTPKNAPSCDDCYFRRGGLCAMKPDRICPTFRAASARLAPAISPQLVPLVPVAAAAVA